MERYNVLVPGTREKFEGWIRDRGGVRVWGNVDLSDPGAGYAYTPMYQDGGEVETTPPTWKHQDRVDVVTDLSRFRFVREYIEVDRFRITLRMGASGLRIKLTDGSSRRLRARLDKAQEKHGPCYYRWDGFDGRDCVIERPVWED
jgi:hypothetical protein